jgi:CRISPR-associated protein Cst2
MKLKNIYGCVVTPQDLSSNNRGESIGNLSCLQKVQVGAKEYTRVSSEAIKLAVLETVIASQWDETNREWDPCSRVSSWKDHRDPAKYFDDDLFGFLRAEAVRIEETPQDIDTDDNKKDKKKTKAPKQRGESLARKGAFEINAAISTSPFLGDVTFNATSAAKVDSKGNSNKTSLYATEMHWTRYQWGFAINPFSVIKKERINILLRAIADISSVAGNHSRFKFDFSPQAIAMRVTYHCAPKIFKTFSCEGNDIRATELIKLVQWGEIDPKELYLGGSVNDQDMEELKQMGAHCYPVPKLAFDAIKPQFPSLG